MNKKLVLALAGIVGYYTVGTIISKGTIVPAMKRFFKYGQDNYSDVEDCPTDEVDPSMN